MQTTPYLIPTISRYLNTKITNFLNLNNSNQIQNHQNLSKSHWVFKFPKLTEKEISKPKIKSFETLNKFKNEPTKFKKLRFKCLKARFVFHLCFFERILRGRGEGGSIACGCRAREKKRRRARGKVSGSGRKLRNEARVRFL